MKKLKIVTALLPTYVDKFFVYEDSGLNIEVGDLMFVPFGKKTLPSLCIKTEDVDCDGFEVKIGLSKDKLRAVDSIVQKGAFTKLGVDFILAFGAYNIIEKGRLFELMVQLHLYSNKNFLLNSLVCLSQDADSKAVSLYKTKKSSSKALEFIKLFREKYFDGASVFDIVKNEEIKLPFVEKLLEGGVLVREENSFRGGMGVENVLNIQNEFVLNREQVLAVEFVSSKLGAFVPVLLYGVTGSGKTEVFIKIIQNVLLNSDKQVLVLLPEITMMSGLIERLSDVFKTNIVIWHSSVKQGEKFDHIQDILSGCARIVVGARSAILLPFKSLGLIVVDEEHDTSYKQDEMPTYNARDMSVLKGKIESCPVLLCSATPSMESFMNAKSHKYSMVEIKTRFSEAVFPEIKVVDTKDCAMVGKSVFAKESLDEIQKVISSGDQVIIFLNRRGYSRMLSCKGCGFVYECPNCDNKLVYHKSKNSLKCHYCMHSMDVPSVCGGCGSGSDIVTKGIPGLERVKEDLEVLLKDAKIALMSADTMSDEASIKEFFDKVHNGDVNVIIGTQIATKGFNFAKLKLVVALNVNIDEIQGDLRIFERTYQLLVQVAGRAGRFGGKSKMIIQTNGPNNPVLQSIVSNIDDHFYKEEEHRRRLGKLPPFTKQIAVIVSGEREDVVKSHTNKIFSGMQNSLKLEKYIGVKLFGPAENSIYKMKTKYRYHILLQCESYSKMQPFVLECVCSLQKPNGIMVKVDVDPIYGL